MVNRAELALGPIAVKPLAYAQSRLALGPFAHRFTVALPNVADRLPIRRSFLAEMLAIGTFPWFLDRRLDRLGWTRIGRGRPRCRAGRLVRGRSRGRGQGFANASSTARLPAGTGFVGHDVALS